MTIPDVGVPLEGEAPCGKRDGSETVTSATSCTHMTREREQRKEQQVNNTIAAEVNV